MGLGGDGFGGKRGISEHVGPAIDLGSPGLSEQLSDPLPWFLGVSGWRKHHVSWSGWGHLSSPLRKCVFDSFYESSSLGVKSGHHTV